MFCDRKQNRYLDAPGAASSWCRFFFLLFLENLVLYWASEPAFLCPVKMSVSIIFESNSCWLFKTFRWHIITNSWARTHFRWPLWVLMEASVVHIGIAYSCILCPETVACWIHRVELYYCTAIRTSGKFNSSVFCIRHELKQHDDDDDDDGCTMTAVVHTTYPLWTQIRNLVSLVQTFIPLTLLIAIYCHYYVSLQKAKGSTASTLL